MDEIRFCREARHRVADSLPLEAPETAETRCLERGPKALSTVELLGLVLVRAGAGQGRRAVEDIARDLLTTAGGLRGLYTLGDYPGLTDSQSARIAAALELARRYTEEEVRAPEALGGAEEAYRFLKPRLRDLPHEVFAIIFLNQKHEVLAYRELFRGTIAASSVHPREVIKAALKENAAAVILCHNHPSGHVSPSPDDLRLTEDLKATLKHIDVRVLDHMILGGNGYFSFAREGLLSQ